MPALRPLGVRLTGTAPTGRWGAVEQRGQAELRAEPFRRVFAPEVLDAWRAEVALPPLRALGTPPLASSSRRMLDRLAVACASGPVPPGDAEVALRLRELRARRAAWEAYLDGAAACGLLRPERLARLRGLPDDEFQAALAECLAAWLFAAHLGWEVLPARATGRALTLRAPGSRQTIEAAVRVPLLGRPPRRMASVDDFDLLLHEVRSAVHGLSGAGPNLLVLAPGLPLLSRPPVAERLRLLRAARQNRPRLWRADHVSAAALGPPDPHPLSDGKFLSQWAERGWLPERARVSAIVYVEERVVEQHPFPWAALFTWSERQRWSDARLVESLLLRNLSDENRAWIDHHVLVVHNPHAERPMGAVPFARFAELRPAGGSSGLLRRATRVALPGLRPARHA